MERKGFKVNIDLLKNRKVVRSLQNKRISKPDNKIMMKIRN